MNRSSETCATIWCPNISVAEILGGERREFSKADERYQPTDWGSLEASDYNRWRKQYWGMSEWNS